METGINGIIDDFNKDVADFHRKRSEAAKNIGQRLGGVIADMMSGIDGLDGIGWRQYTPYFNDGDTCEFRANTSDIEVLVKGEWVDTWDLEKTDPIRNNKALEEIKKMLKKVGSDLLLEIFGDHCVVRIKKDGSFDTEEYEHD